MPPFLNLYRHDFVRVAVCVPDLRVADPPFNAAGTIELLRVASERDAMLAVFPELGLTAYSCDDLFQQRALLDAAQAALAQVVEATKTFAPVAVVGLPVRVDGALYNCAAVVRAGRILGICPKSYLPNYREYYERRQFTPGRFALRDEIDICGQRVAFGTKLLFRARNQPLFTLYVEICEDLWTTIPPSSYAALAGATVLANPSASNVTIAKNEYRRELVANQSARCLAAYLYSGSGFGESTTDLAWDGHALVCEDGLRLAETARFAYGSQIAFADVDLERLAQDRMRQTSFADSVQAHAGELRGFRVIEFDAAIAMDKHLMLERAIARDPFVPSDPATLDARCAEIYAIQVQGLVKRLRFMHADRVVIGVSGGLDSTQALLVCARAMDVMELPRSHIMAYTMPGFATSQRTLAQARELMTALGCTAREIDIRPSCMQMLRDIGHPFADGKPVYDITFENVQAGERTSHLFRLSNLLGGPVVGTSDLTELALGWSTYGVGDHMSHYHVNASVPKTLVRFLVRYVAERAGMGEAASGVLHRILATEISPELVPGESSDEPGQRTEDILGPFELHDFFLYHVLRFGYAPTKVAFMAYCAWRDTYGMPEIRRTLEIFVERFFGRSQYKRSAIPNAPKVGSGGSLSPRGDYRAPSDGEAAVWLTRLGEVPSAT